MGAVMNDIFEFIDDLKELQKLYVLGDMQYIDFQEKISKYENQIDQFELEMQEGMNS
jgi:hypothetical protein